DHQAILTGLVEIGYDGFIAFEYEGVQDHQQATRTGIAYLRGLLAEIEMEYDAQENRAPASKARDRR
ncbi:MAG: hypothetical protein GX131_04300, partial [candidate division WS1 bacterium]|nr:hypothetical protein [candidate division WS1 bacterium]